MGAESPPYRQSLLQLISQRGHSLIEGRLGRTGVPVRVLRRPVHSTIISETLRDGGRSASKTAEQRWGVYSLRGS
jgi:hypothetical protein